MSTLNRSGIFITTSAIPITYNHIKPTYINNTFPLKLLKQTLALLLRLKQFHESACSCIMQRKNVPERFDQTLLKFDAKRFEQTLLKFDAERFDQALLKFDGANPCRG